MLSCLGEAVVNYYFVVSVRMLNIRCVSVGGEALVKHYFVVVYTNTLDCALIMSPGLIWNECHLFA